jgi:hypothetical protein
MIEGLKPTVSGVKLRDICLSRAAHHIDRSKKYDEQLQSMERAEIEGMNYTNGDPKQALRQKRDMHIADSEEMVFLAENLDVSETYILDSDDLSKLGICRRGY